LSFVACAEPADARRRDAGDAATSLRSGNEADAGSPPATRRAGAKVKGFSIHYTRVTAGIFIPVNQLAALFKG